jgi:hypothetical protein
MPHATFCKILWCGLSAHCPTFEIEDHPLSVAHDYVFNSFTAICPLSMCHPIMSWRNDHYYSEYRMSKNFQKILFWVDVEGGFRSMLFL